MPTKPEPDIQAPRFCIGFMKRLPLLLLLLIPFCQELRAQSLSDTLKIKEVRVVSKHLQKKEEAGLIRSDVDSIAMIKALNATLSELISENTPIFIKTYGRGALATASFRGTAPSHTQVEWNGISLNSPMLGMVDFSTIPVYFIDKVSILHGSGSLTEKSGALGGTINLQSDVDWSNHFSGSVLSGVGSYRSYDEFFQVKAGNRKIQSKTKAFLSQSANDFPYRNKFIATIDPKTGKYIYPKQRNKNADYRNYGILQEIYIRPDDKDVISGHYWYQHNSRSIPQLMTNETSGDGGVNRQTDQIHRAVAEWNHYSNKTTLKVSSGLNFDKMNYWLRANVNGTSGQVVVDSWSNAQSWFNKALFTYRESEDFSATAGIDVDRYQVRSQNYAPLANNYGYHKTRLESSAHLQVSKKFGKRFTSTFLVRQDFYDSQAAPIMPLLGLEYKLLANGNLYLKGNVARNYHQPSLNDLYYIPGGNPDLKPEEGYTGDLGLTWEKSYTHLHLYTTLTAYSSKIDNWIIWLPTNKGYWEPSNMKKVDASGLEYQLSLEGDEGPWHWHLNGNYAYTRSINRDDPVNWADQSIGKQLPFIPKHSANLSANLSRQGYHLTYQWNYYSERYTTTSNEKTTSLDYLYPYFMNDLFAGKDWNWKTYRLGVELKIFNLFNEEYRTVLQRPMPRRNYSLLVRFDF
ncbi:TonB-dependent receptor [Prolixibacter denitrificans]|uniref:Iron complex outermembrane receptor protein n=1 Tax=Prolixibacter denitrificans TaxID=1541063 RepID=A0A2P8CEW4_9BACT|nr:TonB-dependent receptor [Prolixibacter denitrificans]PSK83419.1 iron complex outermembrane receptor protein [Prolixibacter denitrificans]GET21701.1 TonB-dependent receptor [Prolixibacter denitrificans]